MRSNKGQLEVATVNPIQDGRTLGWPRDNESNQSESNKVSGGDEKHSNDMHNAY